MLKAVFIVSVCWFAFCGWVVWFCSKRHDKEEHPTGNFYGERFPLMRDLHFPTVEASPTPEQIEQAEGDIDKVSDTLNSARDEADSLRRELRAAQWQADRYKHLWQKTSRLANSQRAKISEYKRQLKDLQNNESKQTI